tara:strand:- start:7408 stop:7809 length:402 start_codon:yes stop_codon:yes gene_type:complete
MIFFEKFDKDLLNNKNLTANEKVIYIICKSFENAPNGCRISHQYLLDRTGIKTKHKLIKCLDRLTMFGMLARKQIGQGTCHYVFEKNQMQHYIKHNLNKRSKISKSKNRTSRKLSKALLDPKVIQIHKKGGSV